MEIAMSDSPSTNPSISYRWREISDLPEDLDSLRDRELESLSEVWAREKERIGDDKRVRDFNAELAREWAIETGIVEGVYTLDRGITQTLIERGIDSAYIPHYATNRDPELVARIIQDHAEVLEGLFAFVKGERRLSTSYIKELHSALLRNIDSVVVFDPSGRSFEKPLEKGLYKTMPNSPQKPNGTVHEYCPPEHVASEMDRLIEFHQQHAKRGTRPHIEASWLHHAFTQIHPFQDGNGRVARSIATLVFIKDGFFPLVVNRDDPKYIDTLESADHGDLLPLVRLFSQIQKRALTNAIGRAVDIKPVGSVDEALAATRDMLVDLGWIIPAQYLIAKQYAKALANVVALVRFNEITERLKNDISRVNSAFVFSAEMLGQAPSKEIRAVAEKLKYDPNIGDFHQSVVLNLKAGDVASRIVVSFHGVGAAFRGLLVAVAYFQSGDGAAVPISEDVFRISYQEPQSEILSRFEKWLEPCIVEGIALWRRTLV